MSVPPTSALDSAGEPELAQKVDPQHAPVQRGLSMLVGGLLHLLHLQEQLAQGVELDLKV
jgi:hypothetical protein